MIASTTSAHRCSSTRRRRPAAIPGARRARRWQRRPLDRHRRLRRLFGVAAAARLPTARTATAAARACGPRARRILSAQPDAAALPPPPRRTRCDPARASVQSGTTRFTCATSARHAGADGQDSRGSTSTSSFRATSRRTPRIPGEGRAWRMVSLVDRRRRPLLGLRLRAGRRRGELRNSTSLQIERCRALGLSTSTWAIDADSGRWPQGDSGRLRGWSRANGSPSAPAVTAADAMRLFVWRRRSFVAHHWNVAPRHDRPAFRESNPIFRARRLRA